MKPTPCASTVVNAQIPEAYRVKLESTLSTWANPPAGSNAGPAAVDSNSNLSANGSPVDYETFFSYPDESVLNVENHLCLPAPDCPLDQFEIFPLLPMKIGDFFFSFTNSSLFMLLTLGLVLLLILLVTKKGGGKLVPNAWQSVVELIYDFVLNLVNEQIGGPSANVKQKFFPCILVTFTFLLFCNGYRKGGVGGVGQKVRLRPSRFPYLSRRLFGDSGMGERVGLWALAWCLEIY